MSPPALGGVSFPSTPSSGSKDVPPGALGIYFCVSLLQVEDLEGRKWGLPVSIQYIAFTEYSGEELSKSLPSV